MLADLMTKTNFTVTHFEALRDLTWRNPEPISTLLYDEEVGELQLRFTKKIAGKDYGKVKPATIPARDKPIELHALQAMVTLKIGRHDGNQIEALLAKPLPAIDFK